MERLRRRIDKVDQQLISLVSERLRLMDFVRDKRLKLKKPLINRKRTKYVMDSRLQLARKLQIKEKLAKKLIKAMINECNKRLKGKH